MIFFCQAAGNIFFCLWPSFFPSCARRRGVISNLSGDDRKGLILTDVQGFEGSAGGALVLEETNEVPWKAKGDEKMGEKRVCI